jgi:hypothetical protein
MWRACGASFIVQRHRNNPELTPTRAAPPQYLKKNDTDGASGRLYATLCSTGSIGASHTGPTGHDDPFSRGRRLAWRRPEASAACGRRLAGLAR